MPWLIETLDTMSQRTHRGVRHTATEAALCLMASINDVCKPRRRDARKPRVSAAFAAVAAAPLCVCAH
eukprot:1832043-Prymnesium_polylepis.1